MESQNDKRNPSKNTVAPKGTNSKISRLVITNRDFISTGVIGESPTTNRLSLTTNRLSNVLQRTSRKV
ncbi:hypothetical protein CHS0354_041573 [Potamilus streckersoni]|uniref:Uncharacterized protein n=1 Tax=Potamilus streckersoni TaxID=2493646 RepID=A0AAE0WBU7_9BIVA|nr:hypothetical protein CHS0354_041573 [Potamilus streckersoni]